MNGFDKLELSTETLRELTTDELAEVAGGGADVTGICPLIPTYQCTGYYPTINARCTV
ncbi:MAG: hypothetical protein AVDCRST_MAG85-278 [uncultured Solirubrobacteraceae bacterium]|uniref:Lantibiotic n=1 Tax=uncultured Solirubrobacteraceae bacterium TaxID=1162706 RepID=A0A6J4RUI8_9ACTN|nr:MAG: hypothetical protein AVDCRST_MAG85-278 [uncultured Solirubrobacteraceae bacterium]